MPATPLHVGPGIAIKALAGRHFSLTVFCFSQCLIDIEPVVRFLRQDPLLHGYTHTYLGATLIGLVAVFLGRPVCRFLLRYFQADPRSAFLVWLHGPDEISWLAAATGAFAGTYSHVLLDSVMHSDMMPWAPWSAANGLLEALSLGSLHLLCVLSGLAGLAMMVAAFALRGARSGSSG